MKFIKKITKGLFIFLIIAFVGLFFISRGNAFEPGVKNNQLAPCPNRPNCVSSFANAKSKNYLEFISYSEQLEPIQENIKKAFPSDTEIISEKDNYMHCTFKAGIWTDDVEFIFDAQKNHIHFRSSSRWGYGDMDANRNRMNEIRERLNNLN